MAIHIALTAPESEKCGMEVRNSWISLVGNLEDPVYLDQLRAAAEYLEDGAVVHGEMSTELSQDAADAMVAIEALLVLDPFRQAMEHLFNVAHRLGTHRSRKHFCEVAIRARLQAAATPSVVGGKLHSGDPIEDPWEDNPDDEPRRRTHN